MDKELLCDWVKQAQGGNQEAISVLYQSYYSFAYSVAFKLTNCEADAKDVIQMSFMQVQKSIRQLQKPEYFPLWLHRIITSKCKDLFRKNRDVSFSDEYSRYQNQAVEYRRYLLSESMMNYHTDRDIFMDIFISLPEDIRDVLWFYYFDDMKINDIAQHMHVNINTIKSRMRRGKKILKEQILHYEKQDNIKLDFHENVIGAVLGTTFLPFLNLKNAGIQSAGVSTKAVMLSSVIGIGTITGAYGIYHEIKGNNETQTPINNNVIKENTESTQAKDAYFALCNWTFDKEHLIHRSKESVEEMRPFFAFLKKQGGVYYETLVNTGWAQAFEQYNKELENTF